MSGVKHNTSQPGLQPEVDAKRTWQLAEPFPIAADPSKIKVAVWKACQCKTQLEAALTYARFGIPVLPCNWRYNEEGILKKYPLIHRGVYSATIDPTTIQEWWDQWPVALIGVPGGWVTGVWYLDVDSKKHGGADGLDTWFNRIDRDGTARTRAHKTGTEGLHFIFREDPTRPMGCQIGKLPDDGSISVKGDGGYVIFPPSPYECNGTRVEYTVSDDIEPVLAPNWLYDLILGLGSGSKSTLKGPWEWSEGFGEKKLKEICDIVRKAQKGEWDIARRKVFMFGRLVGGGAYDENKAWEELRKAAKDCDAPEDYPGEVRRSFFNGVKEPCGPFIGDSQFDDFMAYLFEHTYIYRPLRVLWPASSIDARIPSVDKGSKASRWLDQHKAVQQMTWAPGEPELISNRLISEGGWFEKTGVTCYNLYHPPVITPGDASKAGPWLEHLSKVFSDADVLWITKWLAHRVQYPGEKINHALVLGSEKQGIGKDTMLVPVKYAIGPWNFAEVNPQQIIGRFNGFLRTVILRINEARDLGDINRYQFYDHMKAFTASPPEVLRIDEKNTKEYSVVNCVGIIITTNYKSNGIYLPAEDRRHYVAWSNVGPSDFGEDYWNRLYGWYEAGGYEHVAAYLGGMDLSRWDAKAPPPKTQAFWDIVDANRSPENAEMADALDALGNPAATTVFEVYNAAHPKLRGWLDEPKNNKAVYRRFEDCGYVAVRNPDRKDGFWLVGGKRQTIFVQSGMGYRDQLEAIREFILKYVPPKHLAE